MTGAKISKPLMDVLERLAEGGHLVYGYTSKDNPLVELVDSTGVRPVTMNTYRKLKAFDLICRVSESSWTINLAGRALLGQWAEKET